jgi:hypothetical protein
VDSALKKGRNVLYSASLRNGTASSILLSSGMDELHTLDARSTEVLENTTADDPAPHHSGDSFFTIFLRLAGVVQ